MVASTFSHMAITAKDPLSLERFYTQHFGFQRARVVPLGNDQVVFLKKDAMYLEIFHATEEAPVPPAGASGPEYPGWRHLAFTVEGVDDKLAQLGEEVRVTLGPINFDTVIPGWRTAWIADPEGNIIEITQGFVDQWSPLKSQSQE
jgi:glyoxylase I family protein